MSNTSSRRGDLTHSGQSVASPDSGNGYSGVQSNSNMTSGLGRGVGYIANAGSNPEHSDDEYMKLIEQYKAIDQDLYNQLLENPWLVKNNSAYSETIGDKFAGLFGVTAGADRYYSDLLQKRNTYMNDLIQRYYQDKKNSPLSQVQANAAAGINSDLVGTGNVQPAAENDEMSGLSVPQQDEGSTQALMQIGQFGMNMVSFAFGIGKELQGFQMNELEMASKEISNQNGFRSLALEQIVDELPNIFDSEGKISDDILDEEVMKEVLKATTKIGDDMTLSPRIRKQVQALARKISRNGDSFRISKLRREMEEAYYKAHNNVAHYKSQTGFSDNIVDFVSNLSQKVYEPQQKVNEAIWKYQQAQAKYEYELYSTPGLGKAEGEDRKAVIDANKDLDKAYADMSKEVNKVFDDLAQKFVGSNDKWDKIALITITAFRTWTLAQLQVLKRPVSLPSLGGTLKFGPKGTSGSLSLQ